MRIKMHFHYCFTVYILIEVENSKILIRKNTDREKWWKFLRNFLIFERRKIFSDKFSTTKVFQSGPNDKTLINILVVKFKQTLLSCYGIVLNLRNCSRKKWKKANIKEINFHFFVKKHWNKWKLIHVKINIH